MHAPACLAVVHARAAGSAIARRRALLPGAFACWATTASVAYAWSGPKRSASSSLQPSRPVTAFEVTTPLRFVAEGITHGEASKVAEGRRGEDAILLHKLVVGVADGVGGWIEVGVDSGEYSRGFMKHVVEAVEEAEDAGRERTADVHPLALILRAHAKTNVYGSSTVCLALAGPDGRVHVANLGDSGCQHWRHVRPSGMQAAGVHFKLSVGEEGKLWVLKHETESQQDAFNTPKQLAAGLENGNHPNETAMHAWPVSAGDLIIALTDGVLDNLTNEDVRAALAHVDWAPAHALARMRRLRYLEALKIERSIAHSTPAGAPPSPPPPPRGGIPEFGSGRGTLVERFAITSTVGDEQDVTLAAVKAKEGEVRALLAGLAAKLAADAQRVGNDPRASSPFAKAARAAGVRYTGGKPDDVTVALALVVHDDSPAAVEAVVEAERRAALQG